MFRLYLLGHTNNIRIPYNVVKNEIELPYTFNSRQKGVPTSYAHNMLLGTHA